MHIEFVCFQKIIQIKEQQRVESLHDDNLRQQYDARLLQELQQIRTQNEHEMQMLREEIALQYEKKVSMKEVSCAIEFIRCFDFRSMIYKIRIVVNSNKSMVIVQI